MLDYTFQEEIFPSIQPEPPLGKLEAIISHSIGSYLGPRDQFPPCYSLLSGFVSNKVSLKFSLLQNE